MNIKVSQPNIIYSWKDEFGFHQHQEHLESKENHLDVMMIKGFTMHQQNNYVKYCWSDKLGYHEYYYFI
jgi:hypothetical protein